MSGTEKNRTENTSTTPPSPERVVPTDPAELEAAVRNQVEYYFSKDNLKNDTFLISKMDAQNSVAVSTILSFAKLKALTDDESLVLKALQGSSTVLIVDGRLKSAVKQGRNTIILREITADTAEEDVREIFNYPGCKPITSIKSDIGDTWFVVMESEADAKDVVLDLKLKKRMFGGAPVKARLKSEAVVNRSYYPTTTPVSSSVYPVMYPYGGAGGQMDMQQQQFGSGYQMSGSEGSGSGSPQGRSEDGGHKGAARNDRAGDGRGDRRVNNGKAGGNNRDHNNNRGNNDANGRKNNSNNSNNNNSSGSGNNSTGNSGNSGGNNNKSSGREGGSRGKDTPAIEINSLNFPPLGPGGEDVVVSPTATDTTTPTTTAASIVAAANSPPPAPTVTTTSVMSADSASFTPANTVAPAVSTEDYSIIGYGDKPFVKYQIDDIINIVKNIKEAVLPETIRTSEHPLAMEVSPNVDLLLRQRTFSIDETREQMQQGRPVQRDAVISGEVDYNSVMFGDDQNPTQGATSTTTESKTKKKAGGGSWAGVLKSSAATPPAATSPSPTKTSTPRTGANTTGPPAKSGASKTAEGSSGSAGKKNEAGKKGGAAGSRGNSGKSGDKKDGRNGNNRDQRGGNGRRNDKDKDAGASSVPSGPPLKWGDKPSFANVLKAKDEKPPAAGTTTSPAKTQSVPRNQRSRSGSESSSGGKNNASSQVVTEEDGTWSKQKLPPLEKK